MSYVVTNNKIFQEFDSLEEAVKFHSRSKEFGLKIVERDVFGNLNPVDEKKVANAMDLVSSKEEFSKQIPAQQQVQQQAQQPTRPAQQQVQPQKKEEGDSLMKYIKWGVMAILAAVLLYVFFALIFPIIEDFYLAWRHV